MQLTHALAHRNPAVLARLTADLTGLSSTPPVVLPTDPDGLRHTLEQLGRGRAVIDIDLLPAVVPLLRSGQWQFIAVTTLPGDPRSAKLDAMGIPLLDVEQVAPYLRSLPDEPTGAGPADQPEPDAADSAPPPLVEGAPLLVLHSPKGGAGVSTLAAHLAAAWALQGEAVLLVDLATYSAQSMLCKPEQRPKGLEGLAAALEREPDLLAQSGADLSPYLSPLPVRPGRLELMAGGGPQVIDRLKPGQLEQLLQRLKELPYHHIVIDTASEPLPRTLTLLAAADQMLLVAVPDFTCGWALLQLQRLLTILRPAGEMRLVLNRFSGAGLTAGELSARLGWPVTATLPDEPRLSSLADQGVPWELSPHSAWGRAIRALGATLEATAGEVAAHG